MGNNEDDYNEDDEDDNNNLIDYEKLRQEGIHRNTNNIRHLLQLNRPNQVYLSILFL